MIRIAPSILSADFSILKEQIEAAEAAGADWFHLDVMDGHFVPNITFGPLMVEAVRKITEKPLDVHLMIENPDLYIQAFSDAGANMITVHVEAAVHLHRTLGFIKDCGVQAGVAVNPATSVDFLPNILDELDLVLVMSVNPGFGGQSFIARSVEKISQARRIIQSQSRQIYLEVDGGVDSVTGPQVADAGANILVAGSAIFGASDIAAALKGLRTSVEKTAT
ncbi:ribulose-phosphate 3-epimerase [bacterium]|nr:ribulose-phosphate 3-epimerase [bacterium]